MRVEHGAFYSPPSVRPGKMGGGTGMASGYHLPGGRGCPDRYEAPERVPLLSSCRGRRERDKGNRCEKTPRLGDEFQIGQ